MVRFPHIKILPDNAPPPTIESAYNFVHASESKLGVAKPVILLFAIDKLPVGDKIYYNGVVYNTNLASL